MSSKNLVLETLRICPRNIALLLKAKRREKLYDFFKAPQKRSLTYTVVYRKTIILYPFNITISHNVLYKVILKSIKSFVFMENIKDN